MSSSLISRLAALRDEDILVLWEFGCACVWGGGSLRLVAGMRSTERTKTEPETKNLSAS